MKKYLVITCAFFIVIMVVGLFACSTSTTSSLTTNTSSAPSSGPPTTSPIVTPTSPVTTSTNIPTQTSASGQKQLLIGIATPLTGTSAFLGSEISNAVQLAIADQNARGGVTIAGQNYTLVPLIRDTKADAATGKSDADEMVSDGVKIIAGPFQADAVTAQAVTEANHVLAFFVNFLSPAMTGPSKPYSFAVSFPDIQETYKLLYYIQQKLPNEKSVYSIEADTPDAPTWAGATQTSAQMLGYNFLGYDKIPVTTTDFTSEISRVLSYHPDIIDTGNVGGVLGGLSAQMVKQIGQAGFTGTIMMPGIPPESLMEQTVPSQTRNQIVSVYININGSVVSSQYRDLFTRYQAQYKQEPLAIVASYYDDMTALFQFLNTQNTMDTSVWVQGFGNYKWQSIKGFQGQWVAQNGAGFNDGINRRSLDNLWVSHYENGQPVTDFIGPLVPGIFLDSNGNPVSIQVSP